MIIIKIRKNKDNLLNVFNSIDDKKIILKKAIKENIKCLLKIINELFNEKDKILPIIKSVEINIKLILSISFHQFFILNKLNI